MRKGEHLPDDQAEVVLSLDVLEWIAENTTDEQRGEVLDDIVALFAQPWGKHPLSNKDGHDRLAGLNTASTLRGHARVVFRSGISAEGTGLIEIVAIGPRSDNRVHDAVNALVGCGRLDAAVVEQIWDLLAVFEDTAERFGLELWDYQPTPAPEGLVKTAVATGIMPQEIAQRLSKDELTAALENAWDPQTGELDPDRALRTALHRVAGSADPERLLAVRAEPRCNAPMPRAKKPCVRRRGHPGAHRATP